jgi:predicted kinase
MATVIAGIGVPGSGKTTVLKKLADEQGYVYICPDDVRLELTGDALDHSRNEEAWTLSYLRMEQALEGGHVVVFDATQARVRDRQEFTENARTAGATHIIGAYAEIPLALALERNSRRERVVPKYAIERMYQMFQKDPPSVEDGFDAIVPIEQIANSL